MKRSVLQKNVTVFAALSDPKWIAFAIIGISQNNLVTMPVYASMMIADGLLHFYLIIISILKSNPEAYPRLSDTNIIERYLLSDPNSLTHVITQSFIMFIFLNVTATFLIIIF